MIHSLAIAEERLIVDAIPAHAPGDICFTALEMAKMYATLYAERRLTRAMAELLRECHPLLGGSTFGLRLKIEDVLARVRMD